MKRFHGSCCIDNRRYTSGKKISEEVHVAFLSFLKFDRSLYVGGHDHINVNGISNQNVLLQFHRILKNKKNVMYIE